MSPPASPPVAIDCEESLGSADVSGRVIDPYGLAVADLRLRVGSQTTITATDGTFSATVERPYTVAYLTMARGAVVLECLTRTDPVILYADPLHPNGFEAPRRVAWLEVTVPSADPNTMTSVFAGATTEAGLEVRGGEWETAFSTSYTTAYSVQLTWYGEISLTANVHGLQWTPPGGGTVIGAPVEFVGYAEVQQTVSDGETVELHLDLEDVPETTLTGTTLVPSDFYFQDRQFFIDIGNARSNAFAFETNPFETLDFEISVPIIDGARYVVDTDGYSLSNPPHVWSQASRALTIVDTTDDAVIIELFRGVDIGTPAYDEPSVVPSTTFSWTPNSPGIYRPQVVCYDPSTIEMVYAIAIWTARTAIELPDLSDLGVSWPAGASCQWDVRTFPTRPAVDAVAEADFWMGYPDLCGFIPQSIPSSPAFAGACADSGDWMYFLTGP